MKASSGTPNWEASGCAYRAGAGRKPAGGEGSEAAQGRARIRKVVDAYLKAKQGGLRPTSFKVTKLYLTGDYFGPRMRSASLESRTPDIAARLPAITNNRSENTPPPGVPSRALFSWSMNEGCCGELGLRALASRPIPNRASACGPTAN